MKLRAYSPLISLDLLDGISLSSTSSKVELRDKLSYKERLKVSTRIYVLHAKQYRLIGRLSVMILRGLLLMFSDVLGDLYTV